MPANCQFQFIKATVNRVGKNSSNKLRDTDTVRAYSYRYGISGCGKVSTKVSRVMSSEKKKAREYFIKKRDCVTVN